MIELDRTMVNQAVDRRAQISSTSVDQAVDRPGRLRNPLARSIGRSTDVLQRALQRIGHWAADRVVDRLSGQNEFWTQPGAILEVFSLLYKQRLEHILGLRIFW